MTALSSPPPRPWTDLPESPSAPRHRDLHCLDSEAGAFFLLVNGSKIFRAHPELRARLADADDETVRAELERLHLDATPEIDDAAPSAPRMHALSLAVAQKCNLGCTY